MATAPAPRAADQAADLSPSERAAAGKATRERVPRSSHGEWEPATDRPDPVEVLERQAADRVPELVPLRYGPHARIAVHLLPRRRGDHGRGPGGNAQLRPMGSGVRRRAPLELRRLRLAGPRHGRGRQRLRRDPPRAVGMGRQAARRQLRDRRPRPRLRRRRANRDRAHLGAGLSRAHARAGGAQQSRRLVPPRGHRADSRGLRADGQQGGAQAFDRTVAKAQRKTRMRAPRSSPAASTASFGWPATHRCWCRSRSCSRARS